jgi:hypothetical protein
MKISKSVFKAFGKRHQIKFNHLTRNIMSTLKNKVQLNRKCRAGPGTHRFRQRKESSTLFTGYQ